MEKPYSIYIYIENDNIYITNINDALSTLDLNKTLYDNRFLKLTI